MLFGRRLRRRRLMSLLFRGTLSTSGSQIESRREENTRSTALMAAFFTGRD